MIKLYGSLASPWVVRVAMAARYKNLSFELKVPEGGLKSDAYLALNPMGKIPTLVDGDVTLPESDVICQYLEEQYPEPALLPASPAERNRVRLLNRVVDLYAWPPVSAMLRQMLIGTSDQEQIETAIAEGCKAIEYLVYFMGAGPYAWGDKLTLADCALLPTFFYLDGPLENMGAVRIINSAQRTTDWWKYIQQDKFTGPIIEECAVALEAFQKRFSATQTNP